MTSVNEINNRLLEYKKNYTLDNVPHGSLLSIKDKIIYNLISEFANDVNSSKFREDMTINLAGYSNLEGKLGYDAMDGDRVVEVKPKNYIGKTKLSGQGNFTDFTHKRLQKYSNDNARMCVSGFYNGIIVCILEFDFNEPTFIAQIKKLVCKRLPDGDKCGEYCRSASFGWNHYKNAESLKLKYLSPKLEEYKDGITGTFYKFLKGLPYITQ